MGEWLRDVAPNTALLLLGLVAAAVVHEGGHAVAGCLVGIRPRVVNVGVGRPLVRFRLGRTWFVVRIGLLAAGWCACEPSDRRWRLATLVAGGPLANLVVLLALCGASRLAPQASDILEPLGFVQAIAAALTLFPMRQTSNGRTVATDGLRLYRLVVKGETADLGSVYAKLLRTMQASAAAPHPFTGHAAPILYEVLRLDRWREAWACRDAVADYRRLLDAPDLTREERAFVLCDLVVAYLLLGCPEPGSRDLEAWSGEAVTLGDAPRAKAVRGAVLVATGRPSEGRTMLIDAVAALTTRRETLSVTGVLANAMLGRASADIGGASDVDGFDLARTIAARLAAGGSITRAVTRIEAETAGWDVPPPSRRATVGRWMRGEDLP